MFFGCVQPCMYYPAKSIADRPELLAEWSAALSSRLHSAAAPTRSVRVVWLVYLGGASKFRSKGYRQTTYEWL